MSEVLITLGIIGIVAALTLPSLIQKQTEKATVTKLKKAYSVLQQAHQRIVQEDGTPDYWDYDEDSTLGYSSTAATKFAKYIKVGKNCIGQNSTYAFNNCVSSSNLYYTGAFQSFKGVDDISYVFRITGKSCTNKQGKNKALQSVCGFIYVDVNAFKRPNTIGKDIFGFYLTKEGVFPIGSQQETGIPMKDFCDRNYVWGNVIHGWWHNGTSCTAWVLYNENMDYLHCDLDWNSGKSSCKY